MEAVVVSGIEAERGVEGHVAAGHVHVSADDVDGAHGLREGDAGDLLIELQAPLHGAGTGGSKGARRLVDFRLFDPADFGSARRRHGGHALAQLVEAIAVGLHELVVVQVFFYDDVEHGHGKGCIGAGTQSDPLLGARSAPGQFGIDDDQFRALLHEVYHPMAEKSVGIRYDRIVSPDHHDLGRLIVGVFVPVGPHLGAVGQHDGAAHDGHEAFAGHHAGVAGQKAHGEVRAVEGRVAQVGNLVAVVAAGAHHGDDGFRPIVGPYATHVLLDDVVGFFPRHAFPFVLATFAYALHGVFQAVLMVNGFHQIQAAHAQAAMGFGVVRVAFHVVDFPVLHIEEHATRVVAAWRRPLMGAVYGELAFLP